MTLIVSFIVGAVVGGLTICVCAVLYDAGEYDRAEERGRSSEKTMTIKELKKIRACNNECISCGFCANTVPTHKEINIIIDELIKYKECEANETCNTDR